jgi:NTP pyrophosphatase (non-canonical NTP hydrolase)
MMETTSLESVLNTNDFSGEHITEVYKKWQPKYAAYASWYSGIDRLEQPVKEMMSEASEVLALFVKARRKGSVPEREAVVDELGDTFWGLVGVMNEYDISFEELIHYNMEKLTARNVGRAS